MSWGAFNICSEGHSIHHNVDQAAGAKYGVRYPYKFDDKGLRFWATPNGMMLESNRLARSFHTTSWLYKRNESPSPVITYEKHGQNAPDPAVHIKTLAGWDVSDSTGEYFASFYNQCDRIWFGQNAKHSFVLGNYALNIGTGNWVRPAQVVKSNVLSSPDYYEQRPFMPPTMPHEDFGSNDNWPVYQTKRGVRAWVRDGWAYKKATPKLNDHSQHEFNWPEYGKPEWEYNPQWYGYDPNDPDAANPTIGLDTNLLYLVEKRYSHGPNCNGYHLPFTERACNDRILTGYRPHYWVKTGSTPQHSNSDKLLESWCSEDEYPYGVSSSKYKYELCDWPPYSISCGATSFQRRRSLVFNSGYSAEPYYAKTDQHITSVTGDSGVIGYAALSEMIPPNTAFDLIAYLQVVNYIICKRDNKYTKVASGYFNTKCYCILHQIAPLLAKP